MEKKTIILLAVGFLIAYIVFLVWWNSVAWFNPKKEIKVEEVPPVVNTSGLTTAYGVEIHNNCFAKFQDFIKDYGGDYSKCLEGFDFAEGNCSGSDSSTGGSSNINLIVILDSSGSMKEKNGPLSKIDVAKKAVSDFLTKMPQGVNTGLIVYGHMGSSSQTDKSFSCKGIQEVVRLGLNNSNNIISAMGTFGAGGWTPIAGALDFARNIFNTRGKNSKNYLILVSDGVESCDGDALTAASNLKAEISDIKLNVIGFSNDNETHDFLSNIAIRGGGSYLTVYDSADIVRSLNNELSIIKRDCLSLIFFNMSTRYNANYMRNLNCWLDAYGKESKSFTEQFTEQALVKPVDPQCNLEVSNVLKARQDDFWYKREALAEENKAIYQKMKADLDKQLKVIDDSRN